MAREGLRQAAEDNNATMLDAVTRKEILLRGNKLTPTPRTLKRQAPFHRIDESAVDIIAQCWGLPNRVHVDVTRDSTCLFQAMTVALHGTEEMTQELRLRTTIEMVKHRLYYKQKNDNPTIDLLSPEYQMFSAETQAFGLFMPFLPSFRHCRYIPV